MFENIDWSGFPIQLLVGFGCNFLALLFWFVWPKGKASAYKRINWPKYILRNFHSAAWFLFGMAAFLMERQPIVAGILASVGVALYGIFIVILTKA